MILYNPLGDLIKQCFNKVFNKSYTLQNSYFTWNNGYKILINDKTLNVSTNELLESKDFKKLFINKFNEFNKV